MMTKVSPFLTTFQQRLTKATEDDNNWDEGPWEMRHSQSSLFGDIPNVFDVKKVSRVGKGRSMSFVINVETGLLICKK